MNLFQKEYVFLIPKDLETKIKVGMLAFGDNNQPLYVKKIIVDDENEKKYTGEIKRCFYRRFTFLSEEENQNRLKMKEEREQLEQQKRNEKSEIQRALYSVFKGHILRLEGKKFKKTKQFLSVRTNLKTYELVKIGDIIYVKVKQKGQESIKQYVLVEDITDQVKNRPKARDRKIVDHIYKKTSRGYKRVKLDKQLNVVSN